MLSDESEVVSVFQGFVVLGCKLPPFGKRVFPVLLERVAIVDVTL